MSEDAPDLAHALLELPAVPDARQDAVTPAVKSFLADVRSYLDVLHGTSGPGRIVNEANSDLTDRLVRRLFELAEEIHLARGKGIETGVAIIAVGGYARREMSIHSDVDLLLLCSPRKSMISGSAYSVRARFQVENLQVIICYKISNIYFSQKI